MVNSSLDTLGSGNFCDTIILPQSVASYYYPEYPEIYRLDCCRFAGEGSGKVK
jgi:hypothetical protein